MRRILPSITAALILSSSGLVVRAEDGGARGGDPLQGGVSALDGRQTMRVNLGGAAEGFINNGPVLQGGLGHTEKVPPEAFRAWLTSNHPKFALEAQSMADGLVVDVKGQWDHADKTLKKLGIHYVQIRTGEINAEILAPAKVLIINCAGGVKRDRLQSIRDFVQRGGYLLTTDWALDNALDQTFPGYVSWDKGINHRSLYAATFVNPDAVLARGCVRNAAWKLDAGAHLVRILKPELVRVLVASPDLSIEDPDRAGVLACYFPFGKGYVLHMVGHFDNNATIAVGNLLNDPAPGIRISLRQAIATNFVVAGLTGLAIGSANGNSSGNGSATASGNGTSTGAPLNSERLRRPGH
ncbi:MAG: hypothetical protein KGS72_13960 [Cyanobacteria bacterium REEB67]|nr:hypothetical protein [Cyanobacteria bacterium REEB67]